MRASASFLTVATPRIMPSSRKVCVSLAQKTPLPGPPTSPKRARKLPPPAPSPEPKRTNAWPPTEEPVIRWWNDAMQGNLHSPGPMRWVGRAQVVSSPLVMLMLAPVEALLITLRQNGPRPR